MAHEHSQQQRRAAASALYKRDEDDFENVKPTWRGLFSFTERSHVVFLGGGIFVAIASGLIIPCQSLLFGYIFKAFADLSAGAITGEKALATVSEYCVYMACLGSVSWLLQTSFFSIWMVFGDVTARACHVKVFRSLIRKELSWYDKLNEGISALLPRVQTIVQELRESISYPLGSAVKNFATAIGALAVAFWFCWQLTLVVVSSLPVSAIVVGFLSSKMDLNIQLQAQEMQKAMKCVTNALGSIEVVKCFNGQNSEVWRASTKFREAGKYYTIQAAMSALGVGFTQMATLGMFVQGFWYGSVLVAKGEKDAGQVLTTFWATLVATQALQGLLSQLLVFEKGRIAGTKLGALAYDHRSASNNEASGGKRPTDCQGAITFRNVSFSYPSRPTQLVLHKVCMSFAAGETTFIIGKSGSGKSTIGQLLLRLYRPLSGEICLDDEAISSIDTRWLRENVTVVEQTSTLFNESMFRNIALGKKDPDSVALSSVKMAADFALLTQTIEDLPKGVWTAVGSRGKSLSGGQKQRVAIARAKLRDTPILLLDESTSALDASSRMRLLQNIRRWRQGKTTIIITHEIAHILPQDYVYILEQGKVVQKGYRYSMQHDKEGVFHNYISQRTRLVERDADDSPTFYHNGAPSISGDYIGSFGIDGTDNDISFLQEHVNSPTVSSRYSQDAHVPATFRDHDKSDDEPSQSDSDQLLSPTLKKDISSAGKRFYKLPFVTSPLWQTISTHSPDGRGANFERLGYKPMRSSMSALSPLSPVPLMFPRRERIRRSHLDAVPGSPGKAFSRDMPSLRSEENEGFLYLKGAEVTSQKSVKHRFSAEQLALPAQPMKVTVLLKTVWPVLGFAARFWLILGFISAVTHAAATPAFSYIFSELLSTLYLKEKRHRTLGFTLSILVIAAIDGVASFLSRYLFEYCAEKWVAATRVEALRRLLQQPREFFDEDMNSVARIAEGLDNHAEQMRSILSRFAGLGFIALVMLTFAIVWSFVTCWKVTAVVLTTAPIMYAVATCYGAISSKWDALCAEADEVIGVVMTETFTNLRTIRTLALEDSFQKKLSEATAESFRTGFKRSLYIGIFYGLAESTVIFLAALLFWYGAKLASSGEVPGETVIRTFTMLLMSLSVASAILNYIPHISSAREHASRLMRLAKLPEESHEHKGTTHVPATGDIRLHNLTFAYPSRPDVKVLDNVSMSIPAGACVAIVGPSGSGKSTIASLLLELYSTNEPIGNPNGAMITLSGRDLRHIHTPTVRSLIAIVPQTPTLFSATIAQNIKYGLEPSDPNGSHYNIQAAAHAAGIGDFIEGLEKGYDTVIGEDGTGLSGGQAQRVAIARALVRKPNVLILDEATSALDEQSARLVRESIMSLVNGRRSGGEPNMRALTVIIITHARNMMEMADEVIMLEKGKVVEVGRFQDLASRPWGRFQKLLRVGAQDGEGREIGVDSSVMNKGKGRAR